MKVGDPFYTGNYPIIQLFCDGSRLHGCTGCFCRKMNYGSDYKLPCRTCGKLFYELFDAMWEIRKKVYSYEFVKSHAWSGFFQMEYDVEEIMAPYFHYPLQPKSKQRSVVLSFYKQLTAEAADFVMERERHPRNEAANFSFSCSGELRKLGGGEESNNE